MFEDFSCTNLIKTINSIGINIMNWCTYMGNVNILNEILIIFFKVFLISSAAEK